jgi:hypothetical protein
LGDDRKIRKGISDFYHNVLCRNNLDRTACVAGYDRDCGCAHFYRRMVDVIMSTASKARKTRWQRLHYKNFDHNWRCIKCGGIVSANKDLPPRLTDDGFREWVVLMSCGCVIGFSDIFNYLKESEDKTK